MTKVAANGKQRKPMSAAWAMSLARLLEDIKPHVHPYIHKQLSRTVLGRAGGIARGDSIRAAQQQRQLSEPDPALASLLAGGGATAAAIAKAAAGEEPGETADEPGEGVEFEDLDPDDAGALYEIFEALGLTGDPDETEPALVAAVKGLDPDTLGAFAELAEFAGVDFSPFTKQEPDALAVSGGLNKPIGLIRLDPTKKHPPVHTPSSDSMCALPGCGKATDNEIHQGHGMTPAAFKKAGPARYQPKVDETVKCPNCGDMNSTDAKFCDQCGEQLPASAFQKAAWDAAFINDLPDSSFAVILPGGEKDADGKTTPRSLRKLPFKDASGKVDLPHLRNALSRLPQADLPPAAQATAERVLQAAAKSAGVGDFAKADFVGESLWLEKAEKRADGLDVVYGVVLHPGARDSHGHRVTERDITVAAHRFMTKLQSQGFSKAAVHNLQHNPGAIPDAIPVESFVTPQALDFDVDGRKVRVLKGSWIVGSKVSKDMRRQIENEEWTGYSLEGDGFELPASAFTG